MHVLYDFILFPYYMESIVFFFLNKVIKHNATAVGD